VVINTDVYRYVHYKTPHINADGPMSETEMRNRCQ